MFTVGALALVPPVFAEEVLRVLTWPGYADADLVKAFEKQFNARVEVTFVSTDDVLRERLGANQGRDFDVVAANTHMHAVLREAVADGQAAGGRSARE